MRFKNVMKYNLPKYALAAVIAITLGCSSKQNMALNNNKLPLDRRVDSVLSLMTLEEKVGQMNQYNGFWNVTGPVPKDGSAAKKYEHLKKRLGGLNAQCERS